MASNPDERPPDKSPVPPETITLRPFELSDADDFLTWASDERVTRFTQRDPLSSRDDALDYLSSGVIPHPWHRAICLGNHPVGSVAVKLGGDGIHRCRASVSYRLAHDYWGRGIATEAVRKAAAAVFGEWPHLERLEAVADIRNRASQRVLEKAGFLKEGLLRKYLLFKGKPIDVVMYSRERDSVDEKKGRAQAQESKVLAFSVDEEEGENPLTREEGTSASTKIKAASFPR